MGDVDLHVIEPNATHVYFFNKIGVSGYLDVDNTISNGPEHYYASCDKTKLATGIYKVGIRNFRGADGRLANIQVATASNGVIYTTPRPVSVGSTEDTPLISIINVVVSKDANDRFRITTQ